MLNEMRFGKLSQASITAFKALARPIEYDDGIEPTVLFPRREDVDRANSSKLSVLNTDGYTYTAVDGGTVVDPTQRAKLLANFMAPATIPLKINAQVMLIKNLDDSLVNGSMGKVIGFEHKNLYETDQNGQWVDDNYWSSIEGEQADEKRMQRKKILMQHLSGNSRPDPVVRFNVPLPGGGTGTRDLLVEFDTFKTELPNGEVQASRNQVSQF
jgi:ATP-dependent DNA helicase PIF1